MAAFLEDFIAATRSSLVLGEEATIDTIGDIFESVGPSTSESVNNLLQNFSGVLTEEGGVIKIGTEEILEDVLTHTLDTVDMTRFVVASGLDVTAEVQEVLDFFKSFKSDVPESHIASYAADVETDTREVFTATENTILDNLADETDPKVVDDIIKGNSKFSKINDWFKEFFKTGKTVVTLAGIITIAVLIGEFVTDYIKKNSGAFLVTTNNRGEVIYEKIIDYSCCNPGNETVHHPFDVEIKKYLNGVAICKDAGSKYDCCGGFVSVNPSSRLGAIKTVNLKTLGRRKTLLCKTATVQEAFTALAKDVGTTIKDVLGGFWSGLGLPTLPQILVGAVGGVVGGTITWVATKRLKSKPLRYGLVFLVVVIILFVVWRFIKI